MTRILLEAGKILEIEVLDHQIVNADTEYYSMRTEGIVRSEEEGWINPPLYYFRFFVVVRLV
ncbi:JAB domain-containing protein [Bacillus sp. OV166]|uniref:JAB domain-containing protein n=1 Tax=Bacillus sp. OV166 TaxID=1882763 RepID=UPI000B4516FB|nr:JAB domain-containing protein [Bacillus sp. OV166]